MNELGVSEEKKPTYSIMSMERGACKYFRKADRSQITCSLENRPYNKFVFYSRCNRYTGRVSNGRGSW